MNHGPEQIGRPTCPPQDATIRTFDEWVAYPSEWLGVQSLSSDSIEGWLISYFTSHINEYRAFALTHPIDSLEQVTRDWPYDTPKTVRPCC